MSPPIPIMSGLFSRINLVFKITMAQGEGIQPLYFGYKDTWTCLAPWNAIAVNLCDTDIAYQVNSGNATFSEAYKEVAEKDKELLKYGQKNPVAYSYNDACTAFARGQSAMYVIGNYAIPQISLLYLTHSLSNLVRNVLSASLPSSNR